MNIAVRAQRLPRSSLRMPCVFSHPLLKKAVAMATDGARVVAPPPGRISVVATTTLSALMPAPHATSKSTVDATARALGEGDRRSARDGVRLAR